MKIKGLGSIGTARAPKVRKTTAAHAWQGKIIEVTHIGRDLPPGVPCPAAPKTEEKPVRVFRLEWEGAKTPRGAKLIGHEIAETRNGDIFNVRGEIIGFYGSLIENGGASRRKQMMLVNIYVER